MGDEPRRPVLGEILRAARDGGLAGAVAGAFAGADAALVGAAGGALLGAAAEARRQIVPTADELVDAAQRDETETGSMRGTVTDARLVALDREFATFLQSFTDALATEREARSRRRVAEVGRVLLRSIANGESTPEDLDTEEQREAIVETIRFALEALTPAAVPMLARLAPRRVDHFFRGTCRVLVDLDAAEIAVLANLVAAGVRALPLRGYNFSVASLRSAMPMVLEGEHEAGSGGELQLYEVEDLLAAWHTGKGERIEIRRDDQIVRLLLVHRLADGPKRRGPLRIEGQLIPERDDVILRVPIAVLLELHFVLSGQRIEVKR